MANRAAKRFGQWASPREGSTMDCCCVSLFRISGHKSTGGDWGSVSRYRGELDGLMSMAQSKAVSGLIAPSRRLIQMLSHGLVRALQRGLGKTETFAKQVGNGLMTVPFNVIQPNHHSLLIGEF